jgi:cell division protein FtsL
MQLKTSFKILIATIIVFAIVTVYAVFQVIHMQQNNRQLQERLEAMMQPISEVETCNQEE